MKVWELEKGKEYITDLKLSKFKIINGVLFYYNITTEVWKECNRTYNDIKSVDFIEYVPPTNWSKVEIDTKILVRIEDTDEWVKRHFAKFENNTIYAFNDGKTSFTITRYDISPWNYAKLYTEEEEK